MEKFNKTIIALLLVGAILFALPLTGCVEEDEEEKSPTGTVDFTESTETEGVYLGNFEVLSKAVKLIDVQVIITDSSQGQSDSIDDLSSDKEAVIVDGLTFQYTDVNDNKKLDVGDTFKVSKVETDDIVKFIYKPTVELIAQYLFEDIPTPTTPTGALDFTESTQTAGLYTGSFVSLSKSVAISEVSCTITDDSAGSSQTQDPLNPGTTLSTGSGGLNATYNDNGNSKIDGGDTIRCYKAASGDIIRFVYKPTGGVITQYTFVG